MSSLGRKLVLYRTFTNYLIGSQKIFRPTEAVLCMATISSTTWFDISFRNLLADLSSHGAKNNRIARLGIIYYRTSSLRPRQPSATTANHSRWGIYKCAVYNTTHQWRIPSLKHNPGLVPFRSRLGSHPPVRIRRRLLPLANKHYFTGYRS